MLNKNEIKVLEILVGSISLECTLSDVSKTLRQKYSQTYKSIRSLVERGLVKIKSIGKSKVVTLDFLSYHPEYAAVEIERLSKAIKNQKIKPVLDKILKINSQFICALFGSYASGKLKEGSDIDLLFVIPKEYSISQFEKTAKNSLSLYNADINVVKEESLFEMWSNPQKLNVGNELFKNHIILVGADLFMNLVRKHYVGR